MQTGIHDTPEWYGGLDATSTFEDFQWKLSIERVPKENPCPRPCPHSTPVACHTAVSGEPCFNAVLWNIRFGIYENPEWYPDLNQTSSFEEFQMYLMRKREPQMSPCGEPCAPCHTAESGEPCYASVLWASRTGIKKDPENYTGLTVNSTFEEFQAYLMEKQEPEGSPCPEPCPPCHTAELGEACYDTVMWSMREGINLHPSRYLGLKENSSFEDFQERFMQKREPEASLRGTYQATKRKNIWPLTKTSVESTRRPWFLA